jgi:hypothetical protein
VFCLAKVTTSSKCVHHRIGMEINGRNLLLDGPFEVPKILVYTLSLLLRSRINNVREALVFYKLMYTIASWKQLKSVKQ